MTEQEFSGSAELSAYLDGELTSDEVAELRRRLDTDVALRLELRAVRQIRSTLRTLDLVEVPAGALQRRSNVVPIRSRMRVGRKRALVGSVAAAVAAWMFIVLTVAPTPASADPAVSSSLEAHRSSIENLQARPTLSRGTPEFPSHMGDALVLQFVSQHGDQLHAMYASDTQYVSVFQQPGRLDWEKLPLGGTQLLVDGLLAWTWDEKDLRVVVVEREDSVFTFVSGNAGNSPSETTALNATVLPKDSGIGWWNQITGACHEAARLLGFS